MLDAKRSMQPVRELKLEKPAARGVLVGRELYLVERVDSFERLVAGGLELRLCPRVHLKAVVVDGELLYVGSANWTGAGLGVKSSKRRNFRRKSSWQRPELLTATQSTERDHWQSTLRIFCNRYWPKVIHSRTLSRYHRG